MLGEFADFGTALAENSSPLRAGMDAKGQAL